MTRHSRAGGNPEVFKLDKLFYVYITASKQNGTLYIGVTSDLVKRIYKHKNKMLEGFSNKYDVDKLVYYEMCESASAAITREKQLKKWRRKWKLRLIEEKNPDWNDLYNEIKP